MRKLPLTTFWFTPIAAFAFYGVYMYYFFQKCRYTVWDIKNKWVEKCCAFLTHVSFVAS